MNVKLKIIFSRTMKIFPTRSLQYRYQSKVQISGFICRALYLSFRDLSNYFSLILSRLFIPLSRDDYPVSTCFLYLVFPAILHLHRNVHQYDQIRKKCSSSFVGPCHPTFLHLSPSSSLHLYSFILSEKISNFGK